MALLKKLGCLALLAAAIVVAAQGAKAPAVHASDEEFDQGSMQSTDDADPLEFRWRHSRTYAVVTVYNDTNRPVCYELRYTSGGPYYHFTVPAQGWCCHWTTSRSASYRIAVGGRDFAVEANWVRLMHRPCHYHGTPVHLR